MQETSISKNKNVVDSDAAVSAERKLKEEIVQAGLSRIANELEKLAMLSIRLKVAAPSDEELKPGCSKLGGTPDLPNGTAWPKCDGVPMALLAQIRMQNAAPYDPHGRLPSSGIIYFFYEAEAQKWGFDPDNRGNWKVIYYDGDLATLRSTPPPPSLPKDSSFRACKATFSSEITLPSWESRQIERLKLSKEENDEYVHLLAAWCEKDRTINRLLGHPDQIQGEMQLECQLASHGLYVGNSSGYYDPRSRALDAGADDWQLLLQIDSEDENMGAMWGDVGRVYFWIREQDLKKRDFSNVWLILQCG